MGAWSSVTERASAAVWLQPSGFRLTQSSRPSGGTGFEVCALDECVQLHNYNEQSPGEPRWVPDGGTRIIG